MGRSVEKRIKLVQPSGVQLESTDTRPIKATKLALDTIRVNEIAIENSKTGKVTAVVAILKQLNRCGRISATTFFFDLRASF